MKFDMDCYMLYVYKFRRLIAGCRRLVAGEKGERLIQWNQTIVLIGLGVGYQ